MIDKKAFGLDIGSKHIVLVGLLKKGKKLIVDEFMVIKNNANSSDVGNKNLAVFLKDALGKFVVQNNLVEARVNMPIDDTNVWISSIILPKMNKKEKLIALKNEIEQRIPYPLTEASYDYIEVSASNSKSTEYVVYCVRTDAIFKVNTLIKMTGLSANSYEPHMLAVGSCIEYCEKSVAGKSYYILDLGHAHTGLALIKDGHLSQVLSFPPIDKKFFDAQEEEVEVPDENAISSAIEPEENPEAELEKSEDDLVLNFEKEDLTAIEELEEQAAPAEELSEKENTEQVLDNDDFVNTNGTLSTINDLKHAFTYFETIVDDIDSMFLVGGRSLDLEYKKHLEQTFDKKLILPNLKDKFILGKNVKEEFDIDLGIGAVGLALKDFEKKAA